MLVLGNTACATARQVIDLYYTSIKVTDIQVMRLL
jgi:hypothetical protein